jgi:hypothetical protein
MNVWQQSTNFSNCSVVQRGVSRRDFALLPLLTVVRKLTDPPHGPIAPAAIPEMDFLARRKPYTRVAGQVLVNSCRNRFLCANPEKVDHIGCTSRAVWTRICMRALPRPTRRGHTRNRAALPVGALKCVA